MPATKEEGQQLWIHLLPISRKSTDFAKDCRSGGVQVSQRLSLQGPEEALIRLPVLQ